MNHNYHWYLKNKKIKTEIIKISEKKNMNIYINDEYINVKMSLQH